MPLTYFTAIYDLKAVIARTVLEADPNPFTQAISGLALFTPSVTEVRSELDQRAYVLRPIMGRIDNGVLKNLRGEALDTEVPAEDPGDPADHRRYGIRLTANSEALALPSLDYRVTFSRVVFDKGDRKLNPFTFPAPQADEVVDLALVHHRTSTR